MNIYLNGIGKLIETTGQRMKEAEVHYPTDLRKTCASKMPGSGGDALGDSQKC